MKKKENRNATIIRLSQEGQSKAEIGRIFNITRGRVWQIIDLSTDKD